MKFCTLKKTSGEDDECSDDEGSDDDILVAATDLNDHRRSLLRETADFVKKFKDGFEAGFVAADILKKIREGREGVFFWPFPLNFRLCHFGITSFAVMSF